MVAHLFKKVTQDMSRHEKETIIHAELMKTDRTFVKNCREMDLFSDYGRETSQRFILKIEKQEAAIGRKLNASEIEEVYQHFIEGLKNGNANRNN